ncbi:MAG: pilus assembly protein TadG-related protein [Dehalococcoidia bacterium]
MGIFSAFQRRREHGQALILFAAGLAGICGLVGLSVDVGQLVWAKSDLQKAADAGAFAAARELPNTSAAGTIALQYVGLNGATGTTAVVSYSQTATTNDTIKVVASRNVPFFFMKVLGINSSTVSAEASARKAVFDGGTGILPWGLVPNTSSNSTLFNNACYIGLTSGGLPRFTPNVSCTLKYGAGENFGGDFGGLVLDATGASEYKENILNGSTTFYKVGDLINPQTGNMVGPSKDGVETRLARVAPSGCAGHGFTDVLRVNSDGSVSIRPKCLNSPRIIILPVVNRIANPNNSTILGFAFMFLEGLSDSGGQMKITGRFIDIVTPLPNGSYQGTGSGPTSTILTK